MEASMTTDKHALRLEQALDRLEASVPKEVRPSRFNEAKMTCPRLHQATTQEFSETAEGCWHYWHGPSGTGKTWTAVKALEAFITRYPGTPFEFIDAAVLKDRLAGMARDPAAKADFIEDLAEAEVLVIDDFGHGMSESFAESLRRIMANRDPEAQTIITSNYSIKEMLARAAGQTYAYTVEAIIRRIADRSKVREFKEEITF